MVTKVGAYRGPSLENDKDVLVTEFSGVGVNINSLNDDLIANNYDVQNANLTTNWTGYKHSFVNPSQRDKDNFLVYPPNGEVRFMVSKDYDVCWSRTNSTKTWMRFGQISVKGPGKNYASANLILPYAHKA